MIQYDVTTDYEDYGNGDVIVMGHTTELKFKYQGEVHHAAWPGTPDEHIEFLPDTPATYILFDKQGRSE